MKKRYFVSLLAAIGFYGSGWAQLTGTLDYFVIGKKAQASQNYPVAIDNFKKATVQDASSAQAW